MVRQGERMCVVYSSLYSRYESSYMVYKPKWLSKYQKYGKQYHALLISTCVRPSLQLLSVCVCVCVKYQSNIVLHYGRRL